MANATLFRTILGFVVAPISPGLLAVILTAPFHISAVGFGSRGLSEAIWIIEFSAMLGYPVAVVFGIPLYVLFRSRGWNGLLFYVAIGALWGLVMYVAYLLLPQRPSDLERFATNHSRDILVQVSLVICSAIAIAVFWLIARPDRTCPDSG